MKRPKKEILQFIEEKLRQKFYRDNGTEPPSNKILNNYVEERFRQESCRMTGTQLKTKAELSSFLSQHLFFATITFKMSGSRSADSCKYAFRGCHHRLLRELVGNRHQRKHWLHPFIFYALDDEGSKVGSVNLQQGKNLHIHALILIHPDTVKNWELVNWPRVQGNPEIIDNIKILPFDPMKKSLPGLLSYVTKGLKPKSDNEIYWDFYPEKVPPQISYQVAAMPSQSAPSKSTQVEGGH